MISLRVCVNNHNYTKMPPRPISLLVKKSAPISQVPVTSAPVKTPLDVDGTDGMHTDALHSTLTHTLTDTHLPLAPADDDGFISLTPEQKEELIEKLETQKYELKSSATVQPDKLAEVNRLLATIKACDAVAKVEHTIRQSEILDKEFKGKYQSLAISDFRKIIDLTAPKEEREPDISTEMIWKRSKEEIFKNKTYRPPPSDKLEKFRQKMALKSMPSALKQTITEHVDNNVSSLHIRQNHSQLLQYQKYDPLSYNGLNNY